MLVHVLYNTLRSALPDRDVTYLTYSTRYLMLWIDQAWSEERRCWDTVRITIVRVTVL